MTETTVDDTTYTNMGTRTIALKTGGMVMVSANEDDQIELTLYARNGPDSPKVKVLVEQTEALTLIEYLAIAAHPGAGKHQITVEGVDLTAALKQLGPPTK